MSSSTEERTIIVNGNTKSTPSSLVDGDPNTNIDVNANGSTNTNIDTINDVTWSDTFGTSALRQVQNLASVVSQANDQSSSYPSPNSSLSTSSSSYSLSSSSSLTDRFIQAAEQQQQQLDASNRLIGNIRNVGSSDGGGGDITPNSNMSGDTVPLFSNLTEQRGIKGQNRKVVLSALESLERDSKCKNTHIVT